MTTLRAHLVQADTVWEDRPANHARVRAMLDQARADGRLRPGDLALLPEMFDTGFSFRLDVTADRDHATLHFLRETARDLRITLHGSRTVIGPDGRGLNRATIAGPDGAVLAEYDKIHPFSFGQEPQFFSPGRAETVYPWPAGAPAHAGTLVCPIICYDLRFPELFRLGMLRGAEVFAVAANWPAPRAVHRRVLAQARAIENQAIVLCVNRAGRDPHLIYEGASCAFDAQGTLLGELGDGPAILSLDLDLSALRAWRQKFPALADARLLGAGAVRPAAPAGA